MRNRFNIFTAEEFDDSVVDGQGQVSETSVADQIEAENSAVEINNEISTFEEHCDEVCDATEVVDELQEQVDAQEEILEETPEEVTEDTVAVAQEQFYITMSKIGSLQHYKTSGTISHEISAGTPAEKLKLSCEGVKDFINTVIEKIKAFFAKIVSWFKSIINKIKSLFGVKEKQMEQLEKEAETIDKDINEKAVDDILKVEDSRPRVGLLKSIGCNMFYSPKNTITELIVNFGMFEVVYIMKHDAENIFKGLAGVGFGSERMIESESRATTQNVQQAFKSDDTINKLANSADGILLLTCVTNNSLKVAYVGTHKDQKVPFVYLANKSFEELSKENNNIVTTTAKNLTQLAVTTVKRFKDIRKGYKKHKDKLISNLAAMDTDLQKLKQKILDRVSKEEKLSDSEKTKLTSTMTSITSAFISGLAMTGHNVITNYVNICNYCVDVCKQASKVDGKVVDKELSKLGKTKKLDA